ncbi:uncharacterized protein LOC121986514 [Zingiber officinale]|uniref:uncharacterized protein LOC121986514 n=1 Tax=Zingiber officinale TaxID=94328 RepID=UPI001C4D0B8F|nr:uncharacterized protein LOC121986514 [Zingiber officinale]
MAVITYLEATSSMNPFTAALPLLLLLLLPQDFQAVAADDSLVRDTCMRAANVSIGHVDFESCVEALQSDPATPGATDARGLALISANLTLTNVTRTIYLTETWVQYMNLCQGIYTDMSANVTDAMRTLEAGDLAGAVRKMDWAAIQPNECDLVMFQGDGSSDWGANPLSYQDNYAAFLSSTALAILRSMSVITADDSLVRDTCMRAANDSHVDFESCVEALESDPATAGPTDVRGLALISANLTLTNLTRTIYLAKTWVHYLTLCQKIYTDMSANVTDAIRTLEAGDLAGAVSKMDWAAMQPSECDLLMFQGDGSSDWGANPLSHQDNYAALLAFTALAILRSLN